MKTITVASGQMQICSDGQVLTANLGSCVAVCIYDREQAIGGMLHFLLPNPQYAESKENVVTENAGNFGDQAIPELLKKFKSHGSKPEQLEAIVVGGNVSESATTMVQKVSKLNFECALKCLETYKIEIKKSVLGQNPAGHTIVFETSSGDVYLQKNRATIVTEIKSADETKPSLPADSPKKEQTVVQKKSRILIVDDSIPIRRIIKSVLSKYDDIEIVGEAENPIVAEKMRQRLKPDLMTLDISMPEKDGVTYLGELMKNNPMPVIMISDLGLKEASPVMRALQLGAFDYIQKPAMKEIERWGAQLYELVSAAKRAGETHHILSVSQLKRIAVARDKNVDVHLRLIAIGASTGGTEALRLLINDLPERTPPIVIVQHMPAVFTEAFAAGLNKSAKVSVKEAVSGDILQASHIYIAPGGKQMKIVEQRGQFVTMITDDPPVNKFKPSVDYMFNSILKLNLGKRLHAALLTGMGDDGARGLLALRKSGALAIAQDEETSVVWGMPRVAIELDGADKVLPIQEIGPALLSSAKTSENKKLG